MGLVFLVIFAVVSFFAGKMVMASKPEIIDWSINKKQAISIAWFFFSLLVFLGLSAMQPNFAIERYLFSSIGTAILMGAAFHLPLHQKKQTN